MEIIPLHISDEILPCHDLAELILKHDICDNDILVIAQKIISKQEGKLVQLSTVTPSLLAIGIASQYKKDSRLVELILSESRRIIKMNDGILIVETNSGFICANAGIDQSNVQNGYVTLLPASPDKSAQKICKQIFERTNKKIAVIISDTFGRPFRMGQTNQAIGVSGINPILDYAGTLDSFENVLHVTAIAIADELSCAAELVMAKTAKCPLVIIRNYTYDVNDDSIDKLIRLECDDLFR